VIRVRAPNGDILEFDTARFCETQTNGHHLYTNEKKSMWVGIIPLDWAVIAVAPLRVVPPTRKVFLDEALDVVARGVEDLTESRHIQSLRRLKAKLKNFDALRGVWR
jgi:hypothetical protein